jgi:hypothetical protein
VKPAAGYRPLAYSSPEAVQTTGTVAVYPLDKWLLRLLAANPIVKNLGDVRWEAIEDRTPGKGTGRHIAAFTLIPKT